jgi:hypothetical protein
VIDEEAHSKIRPREEGRTRVVRNVERRARRDEGEGSHASLFIHASAFFFDIGCEDTTPFSSLWF